MQRGKVISYASRQLKIHEKNYTTHELELGAVVFALKTWRHYLYGTKSVIYTDHKTFNSFLTKRAKYAQRSGMSCLLIMMVEIHYHPAQSDAFKQENVLIERLNGLDQQMERKEDGSFVLLCIGYVFLLDRISKKWYFELSTKTKYSVHPKADKMTMTCVICLGGRENEERFANLRSKCFEPVQNEAEHKDLRVQKAFGTRLDLSTAYHPHTDGQSERTIQTLEVMLKAYVIDFSGSWDVHLPLAEFSYNNSYHSSIRCASFETLYGRKCRSPVLWAKIGEDNLIGPELVLETTDKVVLIKEKIKAARDRQKSYADKRHKPLESEVGPFEILERIGLVAYRLRLPEELSSVHDTFHVSNLKKCLVDANLHVPLNEIKVDKTLRFVEEPVEIVDREIKKLKRRRIALVKVRWNSKRGPEFTWEHEDQMRIKYTQLFVDRVVKPAS
ncbi:putative reverse transcriptase domain-containing protein [Tanacetum coccineum]|uniref:Reverse transcriptase domain-containing protein n=1 Tax=Tanacetum coccineum TaxID=301880 RepID=A0ABQ4WC03_9ASTR